MPKITSLGVWNVLWCICIYTAKMVMNNIIITDLYFMLNGTVYLNNSDIPLLGVGEGDHALQCRTSRDECCKTLPNRFGDFYYPNGTKVFNERPGYRFYRNRGQKVIHLNQREGSLRLLGSTCDIIVYFNKMGFQRVIVCWYKFFKDQYHVATTLIALWKDYHIPIL